MASNTNERYNHFFNLHLRPSSSHSFVNPNSCPDCTGKSVIDQRYPLCFNKSNNTVYQCSERFIYGNLLDLNHNSQNYPITLQNNNYLKFV